MLKSLNIVNLAVISQLKVDFHAGLNLLTGETGAGKSIIVDSFGLLLGARATSDLIRTGETTAIVEGVFEMGAETEEAVRLKLEAIGVAISDEDYLYVRREVQASGRNRVFINDTNVTLGTLRSLRPYLIEIHGQGEQRSLLDARAQLLLLDEFGGCSNVRAELREVYSRWRGLRSALDSLERDAAERERTIDLLRFQAEEIERLGVRVGEERELLAEKTLLIHAEKIAELGGGAYGELYENDNSVLSQLASARRRVQELSAIDQRLSGVSRSLEESEVVLKEAADELRRYTEGADFNNASLTEIEDRLAEIDRARRKYRCEADELVEVGRGLKERLEELTNWGERGERLREELAEVERAYVAVARRLSACRKDAAKGLEVKVTEELRLLAMEQARFDVRVSTAPLEVNSNPAGAETDPLNEDEEFSSNPSFWSPYGADRVVFWLSANPGEDPRPLHRVASGGELSRLMLTLRTASLEASSGRGRTDDATLVFDEIDTGIGGGVSETVGRRLKALAAARQVFCVTHQPQIARFADHHFAVSKHFEEGRTKTFIRELDLDERVDELARMIGGASEAEAAREAARWLLAGAEDSGLRSTAGGAQESKGKRRAKRGA
jgi:DNA repair protein RecN (Recombination protein N)